MTFLADANVICEPSKPDPHPGVLSWLRQHEEDIAVDPIVLGEIQFGVLLLPRGEKRRRLERWFEDVVRGIACLPWEARTASQWATMLVSLRRAGQTMPIKDSMIAATCLTHGLTMVTRNVRDFQQAGLRVINPFESRPLR